MDSKLKLKGITERKPKLKGIVERKLKGLWCNWWRETKEKAYRKWNHHIESNQRKDKRNQNGK